MSSRRYILEKLKPATTDRNHSLTDHANSNPSNKGTIYPIDKLLEQFTHHFNEVGGHLIYTKQEQLEQSILQLIEKNGWQTGISPRSFQWQHVPIGTINELGLDPPFSITPCTALVASTGSIVIESNKEQSRAAAVSCQHHLVVAHKEQLVFSIHQAIEKVRSSMCCIISGHSKTADIEKKLVDGAHGPKKIFLFLIA